MNKLVQRDKAKEEVKIILLFVGGKNMFLRIYLILGLPILLLAAFSEARSPPWDSAGRNPDDSSGRSPRGPEKKPGDSGNSPSDSGESRGEYSWPFQQISRAGKILHAGNFRAGKVLLEMLEKWKFF